MIAEMGMLEDFVMVAETAKEAIEAEDFAMAEQLSPMIAEMEETIDSDLAPLCADGGGAAPAEEAPAEEAPAEEAPAEEAPAEEAPAEEAPAEEAPAEEAPAEEAPAAEEGGE